MSAHSLLIKSNGEIVCLWTDDLSLAELGQLIVERASTIEFEPLSQLWEVRLAAETPHQVVFAHKSRQVCLQWEHSYFEDQLGR